MTKSDLLLAGWHSVCEHNHEWWTHPKIAQLRMDLKTAKLLHKKWKKHLEGDNG